MVDDDGRILTCVVLQNSNADFRSSVASFDENPFPLKSTGMCTVASVRNMLSTFLV